MKKLKKVPIPFVVFILILFTGCQNEKITPSPNPTEELISASKTSKDFAISDSLLKKAYQESIVLEDNGLMSLSLIERGVLHFNSLNYDFALELFNEALELALNEKNDTLALRCYGNIANTHTNKSKFGNKSYHLKTALDNLKSTLILSKQLNDFSKVGLTELNIGVAFKEMGVPDSALVHFENALKYFNENDLRNKALTNFNISALKLKTDNLNSARSYNNKAIKDFEKFNQDKYSLCNAYTQQGDIFRFGETLDSAIFYYEKALSVSPSIPYPSARLFVQMAAQKGIGTVYTAQKRFEKAKERLNIALVFADSLNDFNEAAGILIDIGSALLRQDSFAIALTNFKKSLDLSTKTEDPKVIAKSLGSIGTYYDKISKPDSAIYYYKQSQLLHEESGDNIGLATDYLNIGLSQLEINRSKYTDNSLYLFEKGLELLNQTEASKNKDSLYVNIANLYEYKGDYEKANHYLQKLLLLRNSVNNSEVSKKVAFIEKLFEDEKYLRVDKENQVLKLTDLQKSEQIKNKNRTIIAGTFFILSLFAVLIIGIRNYRRTKKDKRIIQKSKKQTEEILEDLKHAMNSTLPEHAEKLEKASETTTGRLRKTLTHLAYQARAVTSLYAILYGNYKSNRTIDAEMFITELINKHKARWPIGKKVQLNIDIEPKTIFFKDARTQGFILNEFMTNSFKHAFPNDKQPEFTIKLFYADEKATFYLRDNGIGYVEPKEQTMNSGSQGLDLIKSYTEKLRGEVKFYNHKDGGAVCEITGIQYRKVL